MKKFLSVILALAILVCIFPSCADKDDCSVIITVQDFGTITVHLAEDVAPITVENFLKLVDQGFYDGLTFHRIMNNFMIQGGDPNHDGTGGSPDKIKGEFYYNGVNNTLSHVRGVISMARGSYSYDSASSQFFIVQKSSTYLDGQYAAFGWVTEGMEVVDAIVQYINDNPSYVSDTNGGVYYQYQPVITSIRRAE